MERKKKVCDAYFEESWSDQVGEKQGKEERSIHLNEEEERKDLFSPVSFSPSLFTMKDTENSAIGSFASAVERTDLKTTKHPPDIESQRFNKSKKSAKTGQKQVNTEASSVAQTIRREIDGTNHTTGKTLHSQPHSLRVYKH